MSNGSGITPVPSGTTKPAGGGQVLQIQSLPDALKTVSRTLHLEGEVVQQNKDGSTRIRTAEGNIDVTFRGKQPQPGARVEIDIPPGNPPRQVTVRTPPAPAPVPAQPAPPPEQTQTTTPLPVVTKPAQGQAAPQQTGGTSTATPAPQAPAQGQPPAATAQAPVKIQPSLPSSYQPPANGVAPTQTAPTPLVPGQIVRLTPIAPALAQGLIQQAAIAPPVPESILASQLTATAFQSDLITRAAKGTLQTSLLQTIKAMTAETLNPSPGQPPALTGTPKTIPGQQPPATQQTLLQPQTGSMLPTPSPLIADTEAFLQETVSTPRLLQLDVKIVDIKNPAIQLLPVTNDSGQSIKASAENFLKPQTMIQTGAESKPATLTAIVTGFTPQRLPLVTIQWPGGALSQNLALQFPAGNLQVGSQITLQPQTPAATGTMPSQITRTLPLLMQASSIWPAADDIFQALIQNAPAAAQSLGRAIPSPGSPSQLGAAALLFVASVKAGDLANWLGEKKIDALTKIGKAGLLSRLTQDTGNIARANADAPSSDWRSYPIPMLWQNEISKVMFHVKHDQQDPGNEQGEGTTRFLFDLDLNRMGEVQLDGLLRGKRLDLVIRTQLPISRTMQEAMKVAYATALDGSDIYGEIAFQGDLKNWMQVVKRDDKVGVSA